MGSDDNVVDSQERQLFGGAMVVSLPSCFVDISTIRQIPDNQEVFSHGETDRSVIIELLELHQVPSGTRPAAFHLDNLAEESDALQSQTHQVLELPPAKFPNLVSGDPDFSVSIAHGTHVVTKFRDASEYASHVDVHLACLRLPRVSTDLLIVFNDPIVLHPKGSSASSGSAVAETPLGQSRDTTLHIALRSLEIHDWSLME